MKWIISAIVVLAFIWVGYCILDLIENDDYYSELKFKTLRLQDKLTVITGYVIAMAVGIGFFICLTWLAKYIIFGG